MLDHFHVFVFHLQGNKKNNEKLTLLQLLSTFMSVLFISSVFSNLVMLQFNVLGFFQEYGKFVSYPLLLFFFFNHYSLKFAPEI